jgi:hypothetical protein
MLKGIRVTPFKRDILFFWAIGQSAQREQVRRPWAGRRLLVFSLCQQGRSRIAVDSFDHIAGSQTGAFGGRAMFDHEHSRVSFDFA